MGENQPVKTDRCSALVSLRRIRNIYEQEVAKLNTEQSLFIENLYREMYAPLYNYAYSALDNASLAEEAVQESFRIACSKPEAVTDCANPNGWIMNTTKYVICNMRRTYSSMAKLVVQSLSGEENIVSLSTSDDYSEIEYPNLISPEEYELIKNVALDKRSPRDMAKELGISVEACKKRIYRAKKRLQIVLASIDNNCNCP